MSAAEIAVAVGLMAVFAYIEGRPSKGETGSGGGKDQGSGSGSEDSGGSGNGSGIGNGSGDSGGSGSGSGSGSGGKDTGSGDLGGSGSGSGGEGKGETGAGESGSGSNFKGQLYNGTRNPDVDFVNGKGKSTLNKHAGKHGYTSPEEYLKDARNFLEKKPTSTIQSFVSNEGTYFRYDTATNEFGIINEYGGISTYFKPENGMVYWLEQIEKYAPK